MLYFYIDIDDGNSVSVLILINNKNIDYIGRKYLRTYMIQITRYNICMHDLLCLESIKNSWILKKKKMI